MSGIGEARIVARADERRWLVYDEGKLLERMSDRRRRDVPGKEQRGDAIDEGSGTKEGVRYIDTFMYLYMNVDGWVS